ncbi:hypothetical protein ONZ45_g818 [Pleurotus djamor]|nr:hypothetical protein ONZ45_g818 [Pleurotus djamor]
MEARFYELNLDILEPIIGWLDLHSHFNLCLVSHKTLEYLATGFLRRCDLKYLDDDAGSLDTLALDQERSTRLLFMVLGLSGRVMRVRNLRCTFYDPDWRFSLQLSALQCLLQSISSVQTISLNFTFVSTAKISDCHQWIKIIEALAEKLPSEVSVLSWRSSMYHLPSDEASSCDASSLPLTLGAVGFNSITSLSLQCCNWDSNDWSRLGLNLVLPSLKELRTFTAIRSPYMFLKFLRRHPTISLLHLHDFMEWEPFQVFRAPDFLPRLQSLHAPIAFIVTFFDEQYIGAKSHLTDLEIICRPCYPLAAADRWRDVSTWIGNLPRQLDGLPVTMKVVADTCWLDNPPSLPAPSVSITGLILDFGPELWVGVAREHWMALPRWLSQFGVLEWLKMQSVGYYEQLTATATGFTDKVFAQLPSMNTVELDGHSYSRLKA